MEKARYIEGIGRRKTAVARVRITPNEKASFKVNDKEVKDYFQTSEMIGIVSDVVAKSGIEAKFTITAKFTGSGIHSQAEAIRHGLARALEGYDKELRSPLKKLGFLKRDGRAKERKKFGLKKARKSPTWSKR